MLKNVMTKMMTRKKKIMKTKKMKMMMKVAKNFLMPKFRFVEIISFAFPLFTTFVHLFTSKFNFFDVFILVQGVSLFQMALALKQSIVDPIFVKPKCV